MGKKITYSVKEKKEDYRDTIIEKHGDVVEFTLREVNKHKESVEKKIKELEAQVGLHAAQMINVKKHHPFVEDFDAKQLHTLEVYITALREVQKWEPLIEEYKNAIKMYDKELPQIYKDCKIDISKEVAEEPTDYPEEDDGTSVAKD